MGDTTKPAISERSQTIILSWALAFGAVYGVALAFLLHMLPPPDATDSAEMIAQWYDRRDGEIKLGATITSYCGGFALPLWLVIAVQISRQEPGRPIWAVTAACGGALLSIALVLPPLFLGVAAFTPDRSADATALMHELGVLTLVTAVQWNLFAFVPVVVVCFLPQRAPHSPFPRWYGYFTAWAAIMFEAGPLAFNTRNGPLAWDGLIVFWLPVALFGAWIAVTSYLLFTVLGRQQREPDGRNITSGS